MKNESAQAEESEAPQQVEKKEQQEDGLGELSEKFFEEGGFSTNWSTVIGKFEDMGLSKNLLKGIFAMGFTEPSEIQQRAIVPVVKGHDTIAQAQSGTGKTGTFSIATLQLVDPKIRDCQSLILAPTRELATQIHKVLRSLGMYSKVTTHSCVGGTLVRDDMRILRTGRQIVVGTPGRTLDMLEKGALKVDKLKTFVLDEADEMLSRGFSEQIHKIFQFLPRDCQVCLFSATLPEDILGLADKFLRNPVKILVKQDELTLDGIKQYVVHLENESWKFDVLKDLYEQLSLTQCIIYCNKKNTVEDVCKFMEDEGFTVSMMHGAMLPKERVEIMKAFRNGDSRVLITTDLLARGIDVQQVSLVINFDLPTNFPVYIHRIGRSGRFGRKGTAINFVPARDAQLLNDLMKHYGTDCEALPENVKDAIAVRKEEKPAA